MKLYKYNEYTVAKDDTNNDIIVQKSDDFYKMDQETFDSMFPDAYLLFEKETKDNIIHTVIITLVIIATILLYFTKTTYAIIDINFIPATLFMLFNVAIHEAGHIFLLKFFEKDSKVKIGFKFVFIYPAFYVDTSYSYLLPKYKRVAIYLAGNFMNCLFILLIIFFFPSMLSYCYMIMSNILINFIPIVKSDGYYALTTARGKFNLQKGKLASRADDFIRGLIMFVTLSILSLITNYFSI